MPLYNFGGSVAPLVVESANVVAQRNGVTAQASFVYNTYTDASNYERAGIDWTAEAGAVRIGVGAAGTGAFRPLVVIGNGINIRPAGSATTTTWLFNNSGHLVGGADLTYNIGAPAATRPLGVYVGFLATAIGTQAGTTYTVAASDSSIIFTSATTVTLTLPAAASFTGRQLQVKTTGGGSVISATSNVVARAGGAAATAILAATAGSWALLQSDGTNWITMAGA